MENYLVVFGIGLAVVTLASIWKIYEKAGHAGWKCLIPVYNIIILLDIVGKPAWYIVLYFIPVVNVFVAIFVLYLLVRAFDQHPAMAVGLIFFPFIFFPVIGFGDAPYIGRDWEETMVDEEIE